MKHLKKLSVVLMMTTLFSVSFTSCIDTEVSPMVEAIYEAQADLIAAQTGVQNAEAALRNAQANAAQAQADWNAAQAAQVEAITAGIVDDNAFQALKREQEILVIIAETNLEVAEAQNALAEENLNWEITMAELMAELDAANVQLIIDYAYDYRNAMNAANAIQVDLLDAQADLADANLMLTGTVGSEVSFAYHLAMLENAVAVAQAKVDDTQAKLDLFNDYAEDPIAAKEILDAQKTDLRAQYEALQQDRAAQVEAIGLIQFDATERNAYVTEIEDAISKHNTAVGQINDRNDWIADAEQDILDWQAIIADYDSIKATLEQAVVDAEDRVGFDGTGSAADHEHNHPAAYGLLGDIDAATDALTPLNTAVTDAETALGAPYVAPVLATESYYDPTTTAYEVLFNAELAILKHDAAYAALTASYNDAATALAAAQAAFDGNTYAADLATAQTDLTTAQTDLATAQTDYLNAKTAFDADTTGSVTTDGDGLHTSGFAPFAPTTVGGFDLDLGQVGIHTDLAPDTYMRVDTWQETGVGTNVYVPLTFYPTKYNSADLAVEVATIIADVTNADNVNVTSESEVYLWEDNLGTGATFTAYDAAPLSGPDTHPLGAVAAGLADTDQTAVFVNVELDDDSVSNLYNFNVATNMLGSDDFTTRPFFTSGDGTVADPYVFNTVLTPATTNAGYDSTPDGDGEPDSAFDMLTAQAVVWNAELEVFKKQNAFDLGDDDLIAKQAVYDAQKLLFDEGLVTRAGLVADAEAIEEAGGAVFVALADLDAANDAVTAQQDVIDALYAELGYTEYIVSGMPVMGQVLRTVNSGNLFISWDVHANDGVPAADVMYEYLASAGWETAYDGDGAMGDADALTAYAELWNAQEALARHTATTLSTYNTWIADKESDIADWQSQMPIIQARLDANLAIVTEMLPMLTDLGIEYTFEFDADGLGVFEVTNDTIAGTSYADIRAEVIAANKVLWDIDQEIAIVSDKQTMVDALISAWNSSYNTFVNTTIPNLEASLVTAQTDLAEAEAALALAENDEAAATANLAYLQALIDTLAQRHANALAVAAQYKALMDAAIAAS